MQTQTTYKLDNEFEIQMASVEDIDVIYNLIKDTAQWIENQDVNQWEYIAAGGGYDEIKETITKHETFKIVKNGELAGTFSLNYTQTDWDIKLWGQLNDGAVYLHKLAISRHQIGKGLGRKIIQWAQEYVKSKGIEIFRLDCIADNPKLVNFYTKCGLENLGTAHGFVKFQKNL